MSKIVFESVSNNVVIGKEESYTFFGFHPNDLYYNLPIHQLKILLDINISHTEFIFAEIDGKEELYFWVFPSDELTKEQITCVMDKIKLTKEDSLKKLEDIKNRLNESRKKMLGLA